MMDKATYLAELEQELSSLAAVDRQNALTYYAEFLEDAEAEGQVDAKTVLGSPHTLAAQIKADIAMSSLEGKEAGETPPPSAPSPSGAPAWAASAATAPRIPLGMAYGTTGAQGGVSSAYGGASGTYGGTPGAQSGMPPQSPPRKSGIGVVWTVVLAILAIPVGVPLAITVIALIFAVLVTLAALLFSLIVTVVALLAAGILSAVAGFTYLFSNFAVGLFYLGAGLVALGLCILVGMGFWQLGKLCVKGVAKLFNAIRKKLTKKERGAQ
jgi:uncharacterized membrane protein